MEFFWYILGFILIIYWVCIVTAGEIFKAKGRSKFAGQALGFFLGPLGVLIALLFSNDAVGLSQSDFKSGEAKKCPYCAEIIKQEAKVCRYCGKTQDDDGKRE